MNANVKIWEFALLLVVIFEIFLKITRPFRRLLPERIFKHHEWRKSLTAQAFA